MGRRGEDDDRPKRTWREIDRQRTTGGSRQKAKEDRERERMERSPLYEQYKAKVSKMFSGGELPDELREKLDPTGQMKERDELIKRIKTSATEDRKLWADSVTSFVAQFDLPEDAYLLVEWLDHPKDRVIEKSLDKLSELASAGLLVGSKRPKSLEQRLRAVELTGSDPDLLSKAKALRERLRA
jgi:hypothetical protein